MPNLLYTDTKVCPVKSHHDHVSYYYSDFAMTSDLGSSIIDRLAALRVVILFQTFQLRLVMEEA